MSFLLPRKPVLRRTLVITIASLIIVIAFTSYFRTQVRIVRDAGDLAVSRQRRAILLKETEKQRARVAQQDADILAETVRWECLINDAARRLLDQRHSTSEARPPAKNELRSDSPDADHWAFRRLQPVRLPDVSYGQWVRNPIDRFILARLESEGLTP